MSSYEYLNKIRNSNKTFFTNGDLKILLGIVSDRTLEDLLRRLVSKGIFGQLEKGKYFLSGSNISDFEIAQFVYSPSYISFETALNYYGILSQFPIGITSATTKKTVEKKIQDRLYVYSKLSTKLYIGFYKEGKSLIAYPEKALFDQFYMISKGLKTEQYLDEMDYSNLKKKKVEEYLKILPENLENRVNELICKYL